MQSNVLPKRTFSKSITKLYFLLEIENHYTLEIMQNLFQFN